ncbi:MAG: monovalent cation/H+ antiporter complex subunit F [Georgenia sp.]
MTAVYLYCLVALSLAALVAVVRMERGPSMLDRVVTLDIITAVVLGAVAVISANTGRTDLVPVLVVLAMVGFVGSVTVARFVAIEGAEEARILSKEELMTVLAQQKVIDDEAAPVHDPDARDDQARDADPAGAGGADDDEDQAGDVGPVDDGEQVTDGTDERWTDDGAEGPGEAR